MRRTFALPLVLGSLALGSLAVGCSSSNDTATSTTTSSVVISAENAQQCKDLQAYKDAAAKARADAGAGGTDEERAQFLMSFYETVLPTLKTAQASAPAELTAAYESQIAQFNEALATDITTPEGRQTMLTSAFAPKPEYKASLDEITAWGADNCGVLFPS